MCMSKCSRCSVPERLVAFKWTDELVDGTSYALQKMKIPALAGETRLACRAEGSILWSIHVCFVASFCLLFIWIAMSRAQAAAVSSILSVRSQSMIYVAQRRSRCRT